MRAYLAKIGGRGGRRSRRVLSPETARGMVRLREARRAFKRFHAVGARRNDSSVTGGAFRFDGTTWSEHPVGVGQFLWDIWVNPDGSYIVVGPDDTIVKRTGS